MRKGKEVLGKSVVSYDTGEKFERVLDLIFDQDSNQVVGFLVRESGFLKSARVLLIEKVRAIGPDAIIVDSADCIDKASDIPLVASILRRNNILRGTRILTMDGRDLGTMVDLYFDEQQGTVEGYEVSGGLFADAYSGRSFVPAPAALKIGEDVAFVPVQTAELMEEQVGGIKGAVISAGDKVQETAQATGDKIQDITAATGDKLQELGSAAADQAQIASAKAQEAAAIASVKLQDAAATAGDKLQEFGNVAADKAQEASIRAQNAAAEASVQIQDAASTASLRIQDAAASTSDKLQELGDAASIRAQNAAAVTSDKVGELSRSATAAVTNRVISPEDQKAFVIGKTAQNVVRSAEGIKIVAAGEKINPEIATLAQSAGVLDALYRAVGGSLTDHVGEQLSSVVASVGVDSAVGRRVQTFIRADSGMIIAAPGQIVTQTVIDRAKANRKELLLIEAVGLSNSTAIRGQTQQFADSASDRLRASSQSLRANTQVAGDQLQSGAQNIWQQVKATAEDLQQLSTQAITEKRIKGALGRPVTRVILDRNDGVILNVGDLITHQAVEYARQSDVLDALLSSVYVETPKLSLQDLRAPGPGKAAL